MDIFFSDLIGILYVISIGLLNSLSPLILELASSICSPASEDIISGLINQANNFVGILFYLSVSYSSIDPQKDTWLFYMLMGIPVLTMAFFSTIKKDRGDSGMIRTPVEA